MEFKFDKPPNKYTIAMGELIRKAREEAGLSQEQLAEKIYRRRLAVSEMENGKVEISAWTLPLLAYALNKPIGYFFPPYVLREIKQGDLLPLEEELLIHFRKIWDEHLQKVAVDQVKVLGDFDPEIMIWDMVDIVAEEKKRDFEIRKYILEKRNKTNKIG